MNLNPEHRLAGILEPVFAIRTEDDLGVGDTGGVRQMIDWCHDHGLNIFQTLPINETGDDHSPYDVISSLAIEPATLAISPKTIPDLTPQKFRQITPPALLRELRHGTVNYTKVKALKQALLQAAFDVFFDRHFNRATLRAGQFSEFIYLNADWLPDYALFRVLVEVNGHSAWERWAPAHQTPALARAWRLSQPEEPRLALERRQLFFMYVQWLAYDQWEALKRYGAKKQVWLMGDIPFGVSRHSADVWANRALFDTDWCGGAPPEKFFKVDPFTEKWGQNWGIASYRWDEMRRRDFDWWRTRVGNVRKVFHLARIDHTPGFFRIYSFPWPPERNTEFLPLDETEAAARTGGRLPGFRPFPDDTPEHKDANQRQGGEILRVVLEAAGGTVIVGENLGVVPDYAPPTLEKLGIPDFRIPAFLRDADGRYSDTTQYPRLSLIQPSTHDHAPLAVTWAEHWQKIDAGEEVEDHQRELERWMDFAGLAAEKPPRAFEEKVREGTLRAVLQSNSWLAVVIITDVFGQTMRFNTPGSVSADNWSARLPWTVKELETNPLLSARAKTFSFLARESGRVTKGQATD